MGLRLFFATTSAGKAKEAKALLEGVELVTPADLGMEADIPETGETFRENARQKLAGWRALVPAGPLLVEDAGLSKADADRLFLEGMEEVGVPWYRRRVMYLAVRVGGKGHWGAA